MTRIVRRKDEGHEIRRRRLWADAAIAYISSSNSTHKEYAAKWADQVLADYDSRFPQLEVIDDE